MAGAAYRLKRGIDRAVRGGRGVILLYHRIADDVSDPYGLCVSPSRFEEHLDFVRATGRPMSLPDVVHALRAGSLPDRAICLTFDDGYVDNLEQAAPLLERYEVPATVFVTTGRAGRDREFWWDELERIFLQPGRLSEQLEIEIEGQVHAWSLGADSAYSAEDQKRHRGWHLDDARTPTRRHAVFREVYHRVRPLPVSTRTDVMDRLLAWAGVRAGDVRPSHAAMEPGQVVELSSSGLVHIGAHTINHPDLSAQDHATQQHEIASSKRELEEWLGRGVSGFAYPYGMYNDVSVRLARSLGFHFACAGEHHLLRRRSDPFLLPRFDVPPGDGDVLARLLRHRLW
jgi:peptidoglycan/xylan/chitin deacetylase (PgdA/CDA1 family)